MSVSQIFISYSWKDEVEVDKIDSFFESIGILLIRDKRDVQYKDNLVDHMKRVHTTDFVMMIISDAFLKSPNCMFEVVEFLGSKEFEERMLPIRLPNATIFNARGQVKYFKYWEGEIKELNEILRGFDDLSGIESIQKELNQARNIKAILSRLFEYLKNILVKNFEDLEKEKYKSLLDKIGIDAIELAKRLKNKPSEDTVISEEIQSKKQKEKSDEDDKIQKKKLQEQAERGDIINQNKEDQNVVSYTEVSSSEEETVRYYIYLLSKANHKEWNSKTTTLLKAISDLELQEINHSIEELNTMSFGEDYILIVNNLNDDFNQDDLKDFFKDSKFLYMIYLGKPNKWKSKKYVPGYQATAFWDRIYITEDINELESILEKQTVKIIEDGI